MRLVSIFLLKTEGQSSRQDSQSVQALMSMTGTLHILPVFVFRSSTQSANRMQNLPTVLTPLRILAGSFLKKIFPNMVIALLFFFDGINRNDIMFMPGPDLITEIMATNNQDIIFISHG